MPSVNKSVLVPFTAAQMYALVDAVEEYPRFLPWCGGASVQERSDTITVATIAIRYAKVSQEFTTRNQKVANESMLIELVDGPFRALHGVWTFVALGEDGCKVTFELDYHFSSGVVEAVIGPVFEMITSTFVDRFVTRAEAVYRAAP
jgi:ribosome-associated toxin RatA of RatAB toxin-antitoxin module